MERYNAIFQLSDSRVDVSRYDDTISGEQGEGIHFRVKPVPDSIPRFVHKCILWLLWVLETNGPSILRNLGCKSCGTQLTSILQPSGVGKLGSLRWNKLYSRRIVNCVVPCKGSNSRGQTVPDARMIPRNEDLVFSVNDAITGRHFP